MSRSFPLILLTAALALSTDARAQRAAACDRACLETALDGYVDALVIRNQAAAESLDTIGTPRRVWAQPYGMGSGWSSYAEAMSSKPQW